jgi:prepilin-type N-terminal cleavage/methylation domain-containing protein
MRRSSAFTLIELLIVITVIAILAAMILSVVNYLRDSVKGAKTKAIMHAAIVGLSTTAMRTNVNISPVEYPLANSRDYGPFLHRSLFVRSVAGAGYAIGDAVAITGDALRVTDPTTLDPSVITQVLLPTDRYCGLNLPSDSDNPMIFGMPRQYLTVIGTGYGLHTVRRMPIVTSQHDQNPVDGILDMPYDDTHYPGSIDSGGGDLTLDTTSFEIEQKKLFDFAFGPEVMTELTSLNGIVTADDSGSQTIPTTLICSSRLRGLAFAFQSTYDPRQVPKWVAPLVKDVDGNWKAYRLRGPALYDAWYHEILCYYGSNGGLLMESAGKDGFFRWNPGGDKVFQTAASADTPAGDDLDGSKDNLLTGQR